MIELPANTVMRKQAFAWLRAKEVPHLPLFQHVSIQNLEDAQRFKIWLQTAELEASIEVAAFKALRPMGSA